MPRTVFFYSHGGPEVLRLEQAPTPKLGPRDVRIKMTAIALNRANAMFRSGDYMVSAEFPSRIGIEGLGEIVELGSDVLDRKIGERVNLLPPGDESSDGYAAEEIVVPADQLLPVSGRLDNRAAATAWVPFLTLYATFVEGDLATEDRWIVLPAASSSVSVAANYLAHAREARTIGLTHTDAKLEALEAFGYDHLPVGEEGRIAGRIREITGKGADFIFDPVGGKQLKTLVEAACPGAEIVVYGLLDDGVTPLPIFGMMYSGSRLRCYTVYELLRDWGRVQQAIDYYMPLFDNGDIKPVADTRNFMLSEIAEAFAFLESNNQVGKVIVTV